MSTYIRSARPFLITVVLSFILLACGGSSSSFDNEILDPVTIDPIVTGGGEDGGEEGGEEGGEQGGSNGQPIIGGTLTPAELALLPQIDVPSRKFSDPGAIVTLNATVSAQDGANVLATRWEQTSGPTVDIANDTRLNTSILVPVVNEETLLSFRLVAQDDEGRVNAATTTVVIQDVNNPLRVIGGIADEGDDSFSVTIELNEVSTMDTLVEYLTFDGIATSALDYTESVGSITIPAGQTQASVEIALMTGDLYFDAESFFFQALTLREDGTRSRSLGTVLIRNATPAAVIDVPELQDLPVQTFTANTVVDGVLFENSSDNGDRILECTSNITLPPGLRLDITELGASCSITGTPLTSVEETEYIITAINPTGESTATITIEVQADNTNIEAPQLTAEQDSATLIINEPIDSIVFFNNGGQQDISCSSNALPNGLSVEVVTEEVSGEGGTETFINCHIIGTPTQLSEETRYTVTASNSAGDSSASILLNVVEATVVEPATEAPMLAQTDADIPSNVTSFDPVVMENTGGGSIEFCEDLTGGIQTLASAGLTVRPTDDRTSCQIEVVDFVNVNETSFTINAVNSIGTSTATFALDTRFSIPSLSSFTSNQTLFIGEPVNLRFGARVSFFTDCTVEPELPSGLNIELSDDNNYENTCVITGTPTEAVDLEEYVVIGNSEFTTNTEGLVTNLVRATISLSVAEAEAPVLPDETLTFDFTVGQAIPAVNLASTGGVITTCDWTVDAPVPPGLSIDVVNSECVISGAPTSAGNFVTSITASNVIGEDSLAVEIVASANTPILETPAATVTFTVGELNFFALSNTGALIDSCSSVSTLPQGLNVATEVLEDFGICYVFGTPTEASEATDYDIEVNFGDGETFESLSAVINVSVTQNIEPLQAPVFGNLPAQAFTLSETAINDIVFNNSGGGELISCTSIPDINTVTPFSLALSADASTCVISGTPASELAEQEFTVTANNATNSDSATITLSVEEPLFAPALSDIADQFLIVGVPLDPIAFANEGGAVDDCNSLNALPEPGGLPGGLDIRVNALGSCELFGTPTNLFAFESFAIEGRNDAGDDIASVGIGVYSAPEFAIEDGSSISLNIDDLPFGQLLLFSSGSFDEDLECLVEPVLPSGFTFELVSTDGGELCGLTIETDTPLDATTYTFFARNSGAFSSVEISLEVIAEILTPETLALNYTLASTDGLPIRIEFTEGTVELNLNDGTVPMVFDAPIVDVVLNANIFEGDIQTLELTFSNGLASLTELEVENDFIFDLAVLEGATNLTTFTAQDTVITGNFTSLSNLEALQVLTFDNNGFGGFIEGDLSDLPTSLETIVFTSSEVNLSGDIQDLGDNIEEFILDSSFFGLNLQVNLASLSDKTNLSVFEISYFVDEGDIGFVDGDIADLPNSLTSFVIDGSNSVTGDLSSLANLAQLRTFEIGEQNTVFGDIVNIPGSMSFFEVSGNNTISGDIASLPDMASFIVMGQNTISGDIGAVPNGVPRIQISGDNTLTGLIQDLHDEMISIEIGGNNTISGDLGLFQSVAIDRIIIDGLNTIDTFNLNPTWNPTRGLRLQLTGNGGSGFDFESLDRLFNHLAGTLTNTFSGDLVFLKPFDEAPSFNSLQSRVALEALGYNIEFNPQFIEDVSASTFDVLNQ